jgi:protein SCO1/2
MKQLFTYTGLLGVVIAGWASSAFAQIAPAPIDALSFSGPDPVERYRDISIEQNLDAQVPLSLEFVDATGRRASLKEFMNGKPALLALVYYECPMLCQEELKGLEAVVKSMSFMPGDEYEILTVSIDHGETSETAAKKKAIHMERLGRPGAEKGWHFLTGEEANIEVLANTVGFRYIYDPSTDQYAHAAGIMALTPDGKVSRYFYGVEYLTRDVEFGLTDASKGTIGTAVDKLVLLCFQYDPATGQYGFYVIGALRVFSGLLILGFAVMYTLLYIRMRRKQKKEAAQTQGTTTPHSGMA